METVEEIKMNETQTLKIYSDYNAESPRTAWDNMCQMICFHKRYLLGDKHDIDHNDYDSYDEMMQANTLVHDIVVPLYLYDHGNISISTGAFSCRWDSGQVGYAIIKTADIIENYGDDRPANRKLALQCLEAEVETYNDYLTGAIFGFEVVEIEECNLGHKHENVIDSCWGFYGYDHDKSGLFDHAGYKKEKTA
jgi:hypothetical protein